jgi:hypothetical protein
MTRAWNLVPFSVRQKKAAGAFLLIFAVSLANEFFDWRIVGNYDWEAIVALTLVGLVATSYVLLTGRRHRSGVAH